MSFEVLLVDDDEDWLYQAEEFLKRESEDLEISSVTSPKDALRLLGEKEFDVIVSDYKMPNVDGLDFLEAVRKDLNKDIPFIMVTGKGEEEIAMKALNWGADHYLRKTGSWKDMASILYDKISDLVENKRIREKNKFLRSLIRKDLEKQVNKILDLACSSREELERINLSKLPDIESDRIKKSISKLKKINRCVSDQESGEEDSKIKALGRILEKSLGYIYWVNSELENNILDVYRGIDSYREDFVRVSKVSVKNESVLEELADGFSDIDLEKSAELAKIKSHSFGRDSTEDFLNDLIKKQKNKIKIIKRLKKISEKDLIKELWVGENPNRFFKLLNILDKRSRDNYRTLKNIMNKEFSKDSNEKKGGLNPNVHYD